MTPEDVSPVEFGVLLSTLPTTHPLVVAARLGVELGALRAGTPLCLDDYAAGNYHRPNHLAEYSELQKRRWPPTGDRDLWIRYGPAGPPSDELQKRRAA